MNETKAELLHSLEILKTHGIALPSFEMLLSELAALEKENAELRARAKNGR